MPATHAESPIGCFGGHSGCRVLAASSQPANRLRPALPYRAGVARRSQALPTRRPWTCITHAPDRHISLVHGPPGSTRACTVNVRVRGAKTHPRGCFMASRNPFVDGEPSSLSYRARRNAVRRMILVTDRLPRRNDAPPGLGQGLRCVSRAHRHDHRCQTKSAVQRWQEAKPLHETGVVSRVPRSARWLRPSRRTTTLTRVQHTPTTEETSRSGE